MNIKEIECYWYLGLLNASEIDHIFNPSKPQDVLMKERVDIILDNTRLYRLYIHKSNMC